MFNLSFIEFKINILDGNEYSIDHPEGASEADILAYAKANYGDVRELDWDDLSDTIGPSFEQHLGNTIDAVLNPIDTITDIGKIVAGGAQKAGDAVPVLQPLGDVAEYFECFPLP